MRQGRTINAVLAGIPSENRKPIVLKSFCRGEVGSFVTFKGVFLTTPDREYVLLWRGYLNTEHGPDIILAIDPTRNVVAGLYGGEWNDGIY